MYTWFLGVYKVSIALGITAYILILLEMFGIGLLLSWLIPKDLSILMLWYGLYFGILGRDCAEVASDQMVRVAPRAMVQQQVHMWQQAAATASCLLLSIVYDTCISVHSGQKSCAVKRLNRHLLILVVLPLCFLRL